MNVKKLWMQLYIRLVIMYALAFGVFHEYLCFNLRGLGWLLRHIKEGRWLNLPEGGVLYFEPKVAPCYARMICGQWNEPETHAFINAMLDAGHSTVVFVDVGANVGEFAVGMASHRKIKKIYAFEPNVNCAGAIQTSADKNNYNHLQVRQLAVSSQRRELMFQGDDLHANIGAIVRESGARARIVHASSLDEEIGYLACPLILLVDTEGSELDVIQGAMKIINNTAAVIIFEYNDASKRHWDLNAMRALLGPEWEIYRLRRDGRLDYECEHAWNCVAVKSHGYFAQTCANMIRN